MLLFIKTLVSTYPSFSMELEGQDTILFLKEKIQDEKKFLLNIREFFMPVNN